VSLTVTVDRDGKMPALDWPAAAKIWAEKCAPLGQQILRSHAPVGLSGNAARTPGRLRESITDKTEISPALAQVLFYTTVFYAPFVLNGTAPHPITVKNARALRWLGRGGIGVNYATRVNHPGTRANPFPERAMPLITPAVAQFFADAVKESMDL
jgi:hypothetical protein